VRRLALITGLSLACATAQLPPLTSSRNPPLLADERALWEDSREQALQFEKARTVYEDASLGAYLEGVGEKIAATNGYGDFAFHVRALRSPYLAAFALPNGDIWITTAMLSRINNEAQLAAVLTHEMIHTLHRDAESEFRFYDVKSSWGAFDEVLPGLGSRAALIAVNGYSQKRESVADEQGFAMLLKAGYDPEESEQIFYALLDQVDEERLKEPFWFGTHDALDALVDEYHRFMEKLADRPLGFAGQEPFLSRTRDLVLYQAQLELQLKRLPAAERAAKKYCAVNPLDARGAYLRGEIARQGQGDGAMDAAIDQYRKAIMLDQDSPQSWRQLGLLLMKRGERAQAREALQRYLELSPSALDRAPVEKDLQSLK
jgi:predicted Zn-dependent protease